MAFLEAAKADGKERFSLLLLEPGEIYFQDFSVICFPLGTSEQDSITQSQKGRLKICSKSVVFDPKEFSHPIKKFSYADIKGLDLWKGSLLSKIGREDRSFVVTTNQIIEMKSDNIIAPYVFTRDRRQFLFSLVHSRVEDCLPHIAQLLRASTLKIADQQAMISTIVHSRQSRHKFDTSQLSDLYEEILLQMEGERITPLATNPGHVVLTSTRLYFQPFNNICAVPVLKIRLSDIKQVIKRRFALKHKGLEIYCRERTNNSCPHLYLALQSEDNRNRLFRLILEQTDVKLEDMEQDSMTLRWQNGVISNFEYLSYLNSMADRSINDLTQYPVFPWVISDFTSNTLDLNNPEIYRDLSEPVGALNKERLNKLLERYEDMPTPKFLYGSHYSTPGYVLFFLARAAPEYFLCLHGGRFDSPDRMFNSIADAYRNCTNSMSDFKELIPEFYDSDGSFLQNLNMINFGVRQNGHVIGDVELPPWANRSPRLMVTKFREALESEYVSKNLHNWIDLIFGYKQRGEEAEKANNVFYHLTYEGAVDLESITDPNDRAAIEVQVMEFGQTPKQLFAFPHPQRFQKPRIPVDVPHFPSAAVDPSSNLEADLVVERQQEADDGFNLQVCKEHNLHRDTVTDVRWIAEGEKIISTSQDGLLKIYSVAEDRQLLSASICNMPLASFELTSDEKSAIVGSWDNRIYIYNLEYGRLVNTILAHDDAVSQVCLSNDILLSSSWDSNVKVWKCRISSGETVNLDIQAELEHETGVNCVCQNTDTSYVVSGTKDGHVSVWNPAHSIYAIRSWQAHTGPVYSVCLSQDFRQIVSCGGDGVLKLFDVNTMTEIFSKNVNNELRCAAWWSDQRVVTGCCDGSLLVWDLVRGNVLHTVTGAHQGAMSCLHVGSDQKFCSGGNDRLVKLWSK